MTDFTPQSPAQPPAQSPAGNSASRAKRLAAVCIDWLLMSIYMVPVAEHYNLNTLVEQALTSPETSPLSPELALTIFAWQCGLFLLVNAYWLANYGQTIGKYLLKIAIVDLEGRRLSLPALILNRYFTQWALTFLGPIGPLLRVLDWLLIFRADHRCLHDLLAKTRVIDLRIPAAQPNTLIV